jgi:hypothetical protein
MLPAAEQTRIDAELLKQGLAEYFLQIAEGIASCDGPSWLALMSAQSGARNKALELA